MGDRGLVGSGTLAGDVGEVDFREHVHVHVGECDSSLLFLLVGLVSEEESLRKDSVSALNVAFPTCFAIIKDNPWTVKRL